MNSAYLSQINQTHTFLASTIFSKEKNERYPCTICHKRFNRPSALQTHSYTHTGEKPYECNVQGCGRRFSVVSNLRRHSRIHSRAHTLNRTRLSSDERNIFVQRLMERSSQSHTHRDQHHRHVSPLAPNQSPPVSPVQTSSSICFVQEISRPLSRLSVQWLTNQSSSAYHFNYPSYNGAVP